MQYENCICRQCGFFNLACTFKKLCWSSLVEIIGIILLIVGGTLLCNLVDV